MPAALTTLHLTQCLSASLHALPWLQRSSWASWTTDASAVVRAVLACASLVAPLSAMVRDVQGVVSCAMNTILTFFPELATTNENDSSWFIYDESLVVIGTENNPNDWELEFDNLSITATHPIHGTFECPQEDAYPYEGKRLTFYKS